MSWKYGPTETRDQRRLVGSEEAARIEGEWELLRKVEYDLRHASYERNRQEYLDRLERATFPRGYQCYYADFQGPLRDGDCIVVRDCATRRLTLRRFDAADLVMRQVGEDVAPGTPQTPPSEATPFTLIDRCALQIAEPATGLVVRAHVRFGQSPSDDWRLVYGAEHLAEMTDMRERVQQRLQRYLAKEARSASRWQRFRNWLVGR